MIARVITTLIILISINCFSQNKTEEKYISVGVYGIGFPRIYSNYGTHIFLGCLVDISLKKYQRFCSSSSLNYYIDFNEYNYYQMASVASGLSWTLQKKALCFRPGIQIGYLLQNREKTNYDFIFQGVFGRASTELTYLINRMEIGLHVNLGMGFGPTIYYHGDIITSEQYLFGLTGGIGIEIKYRIGK